MDNSNIFYDQVVVLFAGTGLVI